MWTLSSVKNHIIGVEALNVCKHSAHLPVGGTCKYPRYGQTATYQMVGFYLTLTIPSKQVEYHMRAHLLKHLASVNCSQVESSTIDTVRALLSI